MGQHTSQSDLVPIGTVVELLQRDYAGISHSSLRFLEREGLIAPTRTPGGHRLYAASDIQRVRQIKEWQAQRLSLEEIRSRLNGLASVGPLPELADAFLELALDGDLPAARRVILDADDVGLPLELSFGGILRPALWELGDRWAGGLVSVAQEKEVSEAAREVIAELTLRHAGAEQHRSVVAACVAGEDHELGLRMMCGLLRARGVGVHFLGGDVDPRFLVDAVRLRQPRAVLLSVTGDAQLSGIDDVAAILRNAGKAPRLLAGGQAVARHPDIVSDRGATPAIDGLDALIEAIAAD